MRYILNPKINDTKDEHRIIYVALSRAQDKLFISVPSIKKNENTEIDKLGVRVTPLPYEAHY